MASGGVLKLVNKYLVQAKKLDKVEPAIAYYCRFYAAMVAMRSRKTKEDEAVASELISWCEKHKAAVASLSKDEARARMEQFALAVFDSADAEDRAGPITARTAAAFFAAVVFMDACNQFGELALDVQQKLKYAAWKATEINRALKEGRTPKPGGVDDDGGNAFGDGGDSAGSDGFSGGGGGSGGVGGGRGSGGGSGGANSGGGGGNGGFVAGAKDGGAGGGGRRSAQDEEDERMAIRYAQSLPPAIPAASVGSPRLIPGDDDEKSYDRTASMPAPSKPTVFPAPSFNPSASLPGSYMPAASAPPPLPPPPSSHDRASAFGFTVDGSNASAPSAYSPGFTGPTPGPHSSPFPPSASQRPSAPPATAPPPASQHAPATPAQIKPSALPPVQGKTRLQATKEADRLLKHAASALSFDDVDTTIVKLQQAVALLHPHKSQ